MPPWLFPAANVHELGAAAPGVGPANAQPPPPEPYPELGGTVEAGVNGEFHEPPLAGTQGWAVKVLAELGHDPEPA